MPLTLFNNTMNTSNNSNKFKYTIAAPYTHPRDVIKKEDGFLAYWFTAQCANWTVRFTHRFLPFITPNWYTTSSLILGLLTAYLFSLGDYRSLVWGVILLHISFMFDCCDGQLARLTGLKIQAGAWFDYHSDKVKDGFILLGFAWGAYTMTGWVGILIVAFLGIYFQFFRNINALNRDLFKLQVTGKKDEARTLIKENENQSQLMRTIKHSTLFKLSDRVLLYTVFGFANYATGGVILYAALAFFFSTASAYLNYREFMRWDTAQKK